MDEKVAMMMSDPAYLLQHYADCASPKLVITSEITLFVWAALIVLTSVRFWRLARWAALKCYLAVDRFLARRHLARAQGPVLEPAIAEFDDEE